MGHVIFSGTPVAGGQGTHVASDGTRNSVTYNGGNSYTVHSPNGNYTVSGS